MGFMYEILEDFIQSVVVKLQFFAWAKKKCATIYCPCLQPLEERCNSYPLGRAEHTHLELSWNHETGLGRPRIVDVMDGSEFIQRQPPEH